MTMAAPKIVLNSYGILNPIKFTPKIRIDPLIVAITATAKMIKTMDPTKRAGLPFAFPNTFAIALMFFV
jgi:hypothetical protein